MTETVSAKRHKRLLNKYRMLFALLTVNAFLLYFISQAVGPLLNLSVPPIFVGFALGVVFILGLIGTVLLFMLLAAVSLLIIPMPANHTESNHE